MAIEIERRFLIPDCSMALDGPAAAESLRIRQGYFGQVNGLRVRVRAFLYAGGRRSGLLTLKGPRRGFCRQEYEHLLPVEQVERLIALLPPEQVVRKTRHFRAHNKLVWSIDCFEGANAGLVIAEVELVHSCQRVEVPSWVAEEITLNPRYGNSILARHPIGHFATARLGQHIELSASTKSAGPVGLFEATAS